jgi:uncharacterized protein (TIGR02147 family)
VSAEDPIARFAQDHGLSLAATEQLRALVRALPAPTFAPTAGTAPTAATRELEPGQVAPRPAPVVALTDAASSARRYQRLGLLGRGGMAAVYRVFDRTLQHTMAMKVYAAAEGAARPERLRQFAEEARLTATLDHRAIVPIHDLGVLDDGSWYYTMREVRGPTLGELIVQAHELPVRERGEAVIGLIELLVRTAEAVRHAHARGVLHQDLKPSNVMVDEHGEVCVLDWGLARRGLGPQDGLAPRMCTPWYLAPEQAVVGAGPPDERVDVYALGAVLFELLGGERPLAALDAAAVLRHLRGGQPEVEPCAELFPELAQLCRQAMHPRPEQRTPSVAVFAEQLRGWLAGERPLRSLEEPLAELVGSWHYQVACELAEVPGWTLSAASLSEVARPLLTESEASRTLARLVEMGLLREGAGGVYRRREGGMEQLATQVEVSGEVLSRAAASQHRWLARRAAEAIEAFPSEVRQLGAYTFAAPVALIPRLKQELERSLQQIVGVVALHPPQPGEATRVVALCAQLFPLSEAVSGSPAEVVGAAEVAASAPAAVGEAGGGSSEQRGSGAGGARPASRAPGSDHAQRAR